MYVNDDKANWRRTCVATFNEGGSFGELALLSDDGTRSATAIAFTTSILLKIERKDYRRTVMQAHGQDLQMMTRFMKNIFLFNDFTQQELNRVVTSLTRRRCERNTTILAQGTTTDALYFVLRGSCRVIKRLDLPQDQLPLLENAPNAKLSPRYVDPPMTPSHHLPPPLPPSQALASFMNEPDEQDGHGGSGSKQKGLVPAVGSSSTAAAQAALKFRKRTRASIDGPRSLGGTVPTPTENVLLEIAELGPHQFFGELSLLLKQPHTASVVSNANTELLVLHKHDFNLHLEARCRKMMLKYANRYYVDNMHQNNDTRGICRQIAKTYQWNAFRTRVLHDAINGDVLDGQQHDSLYPAILDAASQGLAASRLFNPPNVQPDAQEPPPDTSSYKGSRSPRLPALPAGKASPRGTADPPKASPRGVVGTKTPRSGGGRVRVGYSVRGAGVLGRLEQQQRLEAAAAMKARAQASHDALAASQVLRAADAADAGVAAHIDPQPSFSVEAGAVTFGELSLV